MQGSILPVLPERSRLRRHACSKKKTQATPEASDASGDERLEPEATSFFSSIHLYRIPFLSGIIIRQNRNDREDRDSCQLMRAKKKRRREEEKKKKRKKRTCSPSCVCLDVLLQLLLSLPGRRAALASPAAGRRRLPRGQKRAAPLPRAAGITYFLYFSLDS